MPIGDRYSLQHHGTWRVYRLSPDDATVVLQSEADASAFMVVTIEELELGERFELVLS